MKPISKILKTFYGMKKSRLYFNQVRTISGLSISSTQNALLTLVQEGLLRKVNETNHAYYELIDISAVSLHFSLYDHQRLKELHHNVRFPLLEFLHNIPKELAFVIFFGSASRREEHEESDIDLLIVMHSFKEKKLQEKYESIIRTQCSKAKERADAQSNYPLSLAFCNSEDIRKNEDYLIKQAVTTGFAVFKAQAYHELLLDERHRLRQRLNSL